MLTFWQSGQIVSIIQSVEDLYSSGCLCMLQSCDVWEKQEASKSQMPTDMIPPALAEVGQLMLQSVFQHFKHDAQHRTQPPVS